MHKETETDLLHNLVFLSLSDCFKVLHLLGRTDELSVGVSLLLATGLATVSLCVDLMSESHPEVLTLLLFACHGARNLLKRFFGTKVRLIVKVLNGFVVLVPGLLLGDLLSEILTVSLVLALPVSLLDLLHLIHVVQGRVELLLLFRTGIVNLTVISVETN